MHMCTTKAFEINQVSICFEIKRNNTPFLVISFNNALKLHICLKSTMDNKFNKDSPNVFSFIQGTYTKNQESKIQCSKRKTSMIHIKIKK
jgi:hypothetical protein